MHSARILRIGSVVVAMPLVLFITPQSTFGLSVGDKAPVFDATDDQRQPWKSADHVGRKVMVVFFYVADMSTASAKRAAAFQNNLKTLTDRGVEVVGVSGDAVANHQLFKKANSLSFTLLSDERGQVARKFGVRVGPGGSFRKRIDGKTVTLKRAVTLDRQTFVIGLDGKVVLKQSGTQYNTASALIEAGIIPRFFKDQPVKLPKTDVEWRKLLTADQFRVTRRKSTEKAFSGKYWNPKTKGNYRCVCCGQLAFHSGTKFKSGTGWPSFWNPATRGSVKFAKDTAGGKPRVEVKCSRCAAHLGHIFSDGRPPSGHRYCINSAALHFEIEDKSVPDKKMK